MRTPFDAFLEATTYHYRRGHIGFRDDGEIIILTGQHPQALSLDTPRSIPHPLRSNIAKAVHFDREHQRYHWQCNTYFRDYEATRDSDRCPFCWGLLETPKNIVEETQ